MELERRKKIVHIFLENPTASYSQISKAANVPKSTVGDVIRKYRTSLSIDRAKHSCQRPVRSDQNVIRKVVRSSKQNPGLSQRDRAQRYGISQMSVKRILDDAGRHSYRAIEVPNRNEKQAQSSHTRARKLYDNILTKNTGCIIMDDETYVKADRDQVPGPKRYVSDKRLHVDDKFKYRKRDKFPKKYLIWQAICTCGRKSASLVTTKTLNSEIYIKECLEKRLLPFFKMHKDPAVFWPDLASCHYSAQTLAWLESNDVRLVPKEFNPPNTPEFRPIEKYWANVKRIYKKTRAAVRDQKSMQRIWDQCAEKVDRHVVQKSMATLNRNVRAYIRTRKLPE